MKLRVVRDYCRIAYCKCRVVSVAAALVYHESARLLSRKIGLPMLYEMKKIIGPEEEQVDS
jgi:hypothetical protein